MWLCISKGFLAPISTVDLVGDGLMPLLAIWNGGQLQGLFLGESVPWRYLRIAFEGVPENGAAVVQVFFQALEVLAFMLRLPHEVGEFFWVGDARTIRRDQQGFGT
ncbi:hypothetical protein H010_13331 [Hydrogenophaga taeniospiralis CCUG 15921]|uniref:Uncharacterized protein n=1 Tax=Hydrogenophaga taeniospiralis CCUG 15921 TaxID=1281780 RepID=A0A9X4NS74_9BURK|nr:hypothetical protein [Hydrogenophaga taeniospiralis CCUG 15921]